MNHQEQTNKSRQQIKTLLSEGLSEPEYYGDLVYKVKKRVGRNDFSFRFRKIITRYRRIGNNLNVMRQSACLGFECYATVCMLRLGSFKTGLRSPVILYY